LDLVDIHSHILYGLDDGARTLEDSVAMLQVAAAAGTTDIVATPHASPRYKFQPDSIRERLAEVEAAAGGAAKLYTGCDFHLTYDNIEDSLAHPRKYTIHGNRYLLVEFSDLMIFPNTGEIFQRLQDADMAPIITHPERNQLLQFRIEEIASWVSAGAFVQVTGQSLTGHFGKKAAAFSRALLDRGLVHFIASDGHDLKHRPPRMDEARAWLVENFSEQIAELLCQTNPHAVLTGDSVTAPPKSEKSDRKWYRFWR
jgi:protein-tyrosine phosphatase